MTKEKKEETKQVGYRFQNFVAAEVGLEIFPTGIVPEPEGVILDWLFSPNGPTMVYNLYANLDVLRKTGYANLEVSQWCNRLQTKAEKIYPDLANSPDAIDEILKSDIVKIYDSILYSPIAIMKTWPNFSPELQEKTADIIYKFLVYMHDRVPYDIPHEPLKDYITKRNSKMEGK